MKRIKLFEQFGDNDSIKAINELFMSFFISKALNAMDLKKIETRNYIYFYTITSSFNLEFVFSKEISLLHYPQNKIETLSKEIPYSLSPPTRALITQMAEHFKRERFLYGVLSPVYRKLLKEHLSQYINVDFRVAFLNSTSWSQYERNFKKLKKG
jgi:hypothetical protein